MYTETHTIEFHINTEYAYMVFSHTATHKHTLKGSTLLETHLAPLAYAKVIFSVGRPQYSEGVKFHICQGGEGKGTEGWLRCTRSHMETGFRSKLLVTRSAASISCRFSVFELRGNHRGTQCPFPSYSTMCGLH